MLVSIANERSLALIEPITFIVGSYFATIFFRNPFDRTDYCLACWLVTMLSSKDPCKNLEYLLDLHFLSLEYLASLHLVEVIAAFPFLIRVASISPVFTYTKLQSGSIDNFSLSEI